MKVKTLAIAAGVSTPLILGGSASGGFVGITAVVKHNPFGLAVFNIYAEFDRPGEDHMLSVSGTPNAPMLIQVMFGEFYNHPFGTDKAPNPYLLDLFPSLAFDTFVTIGKKTSTDDQLTIMPGFPLGIIGSSLSTNSSGWAVTPNNPQGNPFDAVNSFPGNGKILIGQFSTADGCCVGATMLLEFVSNGVSESQLVSIFISPTPGALAMMGVAVLIGTRRRRRHPPD